MIYYPVLSQYSLTFGAPNSTYSTCQTGVWAPTHRHHTLARLSTSNSRRRRWRRRSSLSRFPRRSRRRRPRWSSLKQRPKRISTLPSNTSWRPTTPKSLPTPLCWSTQRPKSVVLPRARARHAHRLTLSSGCGSPGWSRPSSPPPRLSTRPVRHAPLRLRLRLRLTRTAPPG